MSASTYNSFTNTENAASILAKHLGKGFEHWVKYLKRDQRRSEKNREFPLWAILHGERYYDLSDIYRFVARRNPTALGFPAHGEHEECAVGSTFMPNVTVQCRYDERCRLVVRVDVDDYYGDPILSPETARKLGQQLIDAARYCDSHALDYWDWKVAPVLEAEVPSPLMLKVKEKMAELRSARGICARK